MPAAKKRIPAYEFKQINCEVKNIGRVEETFKKVILEGWKFHSMVLGLRGVGHYFFTRENSQE